MHLTKTISVSILLCTGVVAQDCSTRKLFFNASTRNFNRVAGVHAENLKGTFRDQPIAVTVVKAVQLAPRVMIMLDTSGSMSTYGDRAYENLALRPLLHNTVEFLPRGSSLAFGTFDTKLGDVTDFETERANVVQRLEGITARQGEFKGRTALLESLDAAIAKFGQIRPGDSVILFTDAGDNRSNHVGAAIKRLKYSGLRFFVFLFVKTGRGTPEEIDGPNRLRELASGSGGAIMPVHALLDIKQRGMDVALATAASQIATRIASPYELTFRLPEGSQRVEQLRLKSVGLKDITLEYPTMVPPCDQLTASAPAQP